MTTIEAPAKLTWSLRITGVRDDGLHLVDAEMVTLDLADVIELDETDDESTRFVVTAAWPATAQDAALGDDDLIRRALRAVGRRAHVSVVKRIPMGAGLGGGSADAAAILRWANRTESPLALSLGADVPFCCVGGRARVRGVGELVEPLAPLRRTVTLALPGFSVSTARCYAAFDELGPEQRAHPRNELTTAAERVAPRLGPLRAWLEATTGTSFVLAGSGSTLYCEGDPFKVGSARGDVVQTPDGELRVVVATTQG